jgi:hypothetical protein
MQRKKQWNKMRKKNLKSGLEKQTERIKCCWVPRGTVWQSVGPAGGQVHSLAGSGIYRV